VPTKILILEVRGNLARAVAAFLPGQGNVVHAAPAAKSSLAIVARFRPDLILLQVENPVDWGLLREIRATSDVPLILCSSTWSQTDLIQGLRQGADDYVRWPSSPIALGARILARLRRAQWDAAGEPSYP
jgi:DNA-binding response OmpR family regulator